MADISDNGSFNSNLANITSANYGPTATAGQANTNANTQVQQQAAQAQSMQNRILQARLPAIIAGIHDETAGRGDQSGVGGAAANVGQRSSAGPQTPGQDVADQDRSEVAPDQNFYQPALIDSAYRAQFAIPQLTQQEKQAFDKARVVDPGDQYGMGPKQVLQARDLRLASQTQQSQLAAQDEFDKMHAVTDAPDGGAMNILETSHPDTVKAIRRQFAKDPDAAMDEDAAARMFASHAAGAVHQYTGRKAVKGDDGVYRDEATGITIPGVERVGLSTEQYLKSAHEGMAPMNVPDGNGGTTQVPTWQRARDMGAKNINSLGDWVMVRGSQQGLPGASSTLSPNSAQKQEARSVAQAAVDKATAQRAAASAPTNGTNTKDGVSRNAQGNIDPKLTDALNDTEFKYTPKMPDGTPYASKIGNTPPPSVQKDMDDQTAARTALKKASDGGVGASAAALTMYKAAQDVLAKGNYDGGAWNQELAKYSKWLPAGWQNHMTGDYQEIAKYLGQAALQSGKGIFSKMTEKESDQIQHELNPSPGMDPGALKEMVARGAKTAQYSLDSSKRVTGYIAKGGDATQFNTWNQKHFPMEEETKPTTANPNAGVTAPKYSDQKVRAYMQKHGLTDEQATRKALGMT